MSGAGSAALLAGGAPLIAGCGATAGPTAAVIRTVSLPRPRPRGPLSLEDALQRRRSVREYADVQLSLRELSQLLWAAQGITADWGGRTSPSAGALYPLELYVVASSLCGHYRPHGHRLDVLSDRDLRGELAAAALGQAPIRNASATLVVTAVYARTVSKYGARGRRYAELEAGHTAQNVLLQAAALGLGAVPIGAFEDRRVIAVLRAPEDRAALYLVAIGHPRAQPPSS